MNRLALEEANEQRGHVHAYDQGDGAVYGDAGAVD